MYKLLVSLLALSMMAGAQVGGAPGVTGSAAGTAGPASISGTPTVGQIALWVNSTTLQGVATLPSLSLAGTGSGNLNLIQGSGHTAPVNGFGLQAPTSIPSGYLWTVPTADCSGGLTVSADVLSCNLTGTSAAFATATTAGTCVQSTTAIVGATTSMTAVASPVSTPGVGAQWSAFVSSAGNVTINECAVAVSAGGTIAFNIRLIP